MAKPANIAENISLTSIMVHEVLMCAMCLQIAIRLIFHSGRFEWAMAYFFCILVYVLLIRFGKANKNPVFYRIRLLWNVIAMNFAFTSIKSIVPLIGAPISDSALANIDVFIIGQDLSILAQTVYSKPLTEIMSLGYMLFIVFLSFAFLYYGSGDIRRLTVFCVGIFSLYGIGISGYTIVPAEGPYVHFAELYSKPIEGYLFTSLNALMVKLGSSRFDVFPSLHVGVGLYLLLFFRRWSRSLYHAYLVPFILLTISTVYLRYHYVTDILCGAPLGALCYWGSVVFAKRIGFTEDHSISREEDYDFQPAK